MRLFDGVWGEDPLGDTVNLMIVGLDILYQLECDCTSGDVSEIVRGSSMNLFLECSCGVEGGLAMWPLCRYTQFIFCSGVAYLRWVLIRLEWIAPLDIIPLHQDISRLIYLCAV